MLTMNTPFTFGIEIEMAVALVLDGEEHPNPNETRTVVFPSINRRGSRTSTGRGSTRYNYGPRIHSEFIRVMEMAGFHVQSFQRPHNDVTKWAVTGDASIKHPPDQPVGDELTDTEGYEWTGVEVKSPALPLTAESLEEVRKMCELLRKHFKIIVNSTCGLHVHVGHGQKGFTNSNVKRIMAFMYAFEPQLDTLHPLHRLSNEYCTTMRRRCNLTREHEARFGEAPTTLTAITRMLTIPQRNTRSILRSLSQMTRIGRQGKQGAYNFNGVADLPDRVLSYRPTIEFRQHEGTCDGERITQWVQALVGLLRFVEGEEHESFVDFLTSVALAEKWTKRSDGLDAQREAEMGPILADSPFTVIDLFKHCDMPQAVAYYTDKVRRHSIVRDEDPSPGKFKWTYAPDFASLSREEQERLEKRREQFDMLRRVQHAAQLAGSEWIFDEDDGSWPDHEENYDYESGSGSDVVSEESEE